MATFLWYLQGTTPTEIEATDKLQFAAGTFDSKITVAEYNSSTHVKSSIGNDDSAANTPNNVKFIAAGTADWGDGTEDLNLITDAECTLKINFANDPTVITEDAIFYSYDGTTTATPAVGVDFQAAEKGDAAWTEAEGSGSALTINDDLTGTSHDYFIAVSASPTSVGVKTGKMRIELTYS